MGIKWNCFVMVRRRLFGNIVDNNVVEEPTDHEEIGLRGLISMFLTKMRGGLLEKGTSSFHIY